MPGGSLSYFEHGGHGLVTVIKPLGGTEVTFAYDALLRRIRMSEGAIQTESAEEKGMSAEGAKNAEEVPGKKRLEGKGPKPLVLNVLCVLGGPAFARAP